MTLFGEPSPDPVPAAEVFEYERLLYSLVEPPNTPMRRVFDAFYRAARPLDVHGAVNLTGIRPSRLLDVIYALEDLHQLGRVTGRPDGEPTHWVMTSNARQACARVREEGTFQK